MIREIRASVEFSGNMFSPRQAEQKTGLEFARKHEPGTTPKGEKSQGRRSFYGFASLEAPEDIQDHEKILWLANTLRPKMSLLKECGAKDAYFYIGYFYTAQCNCTLTSEVLKSLADRGIDFWFSCYDMTDDE